MQQEMFLGREMLWIMDNAVSEWSEIMHECSYVEAARPQYTLQNMSECTVIYSRVPDNREKWNSGVFFMTDEMQAYRLNSAEMSGKIYVFKILF